MKKTESDVDKMVAKGMDFGAGVAYLAVGAMTDALHKLEKEGKIDKEVSEKLVQEATKKYEAEGKKYLKKVKGQMDQLMKSSPFVTRKQMDELNAKIKSINKLLAKSTKNKK